VLGWRYQIKPLAKLGFRVIVPDLRGYGLTDAPFVAPNDEKALRQYGWKNLCKDLIELVDHEHQKHHPSNSIHTGAKTAAIYIGHDWGGMLVWRMCLHYPDRIKAVGAVCTAFTPPQSKYISVDEIVKFLPQFEYQRWFAQPETDKELDSKVESFFRVVFRSSKEEGLKDLTSLGREPLPTNPESIPKSKLLSEREFNYYVEMYRQRGFHGGLNYYRARKINFEDELNLAKTIPHPALMVTFKRAAFSKSIVT
jgi:soluble epoxide hydrolase/lipid-phosphate phosphatase